MAPFHLHYLKTIRLGGSARDLAVRRWRKMLSLRIASKLGKQEGWMAEQMLIVGRGKSRRREP